MKPIQYRDIFTRAWDITRKHTFLWWFGLLIVLGGGSGSFTYGGGSDPSSSSVQDEEIIRFVMDHIVLIGAGVIVLVLIALAFFVLRFFAQAAIVKAVCSE